MFGHQENLKAKGETRGPHRTSPEWKGRCFNLERTVGPRNDHNWATSAKGRGWTLPAVIETCTNTPSTYQLLNTFSMCSTRTCWFRDEITEIGHYLNVRERENDWNNWRLWLILFYSFIIWFNFIGQKVHRIFFSYTRVLNRGITCF